MDRREESPRPRWPEQQQQRPAFLSLTHSSRPVELPHPYTSAYHTNHPASGHGASQNYFSHVQPSPTSPLWDTSHHPVKTPLERWPGERPHQSLGTNYGLDQREMAKMAMAPPCRSERSASIERTRSRSAETVPPSSMISVEDDGALTRAQERSTVKKIQRRTKTGCLTCRKRRVKCDEQRPACNNCTKSKRDCLGYEVLFREHNGVNALARAPSGVPSNASSPISLAASKSPRVASSSPLQTPVSVSNLPDYPPDTQQAVLESVYSSLPQPHHGTVVKRKAAPDNSAAASPTSRPSPVESVHISIGISQRTGHILAVLLLLPRCGPPADMGVDHFLSQASVMPDPPTNVEDDALYQDIVMVYHEIYASALHAFFESKWFYFMENGKMAFPRQRPLLQVMASFLTAAAEADAGSQDKMAYVAGLEMKVVWELAKTAATAAPPNTDNRRATILPSEANPVEAQHRFHVVDALLSGTILPWNPLAPPMQDAQHHRVREFEFWYQLAELLRPGVPGVDEQTEATRRANALEKMRNHLDGRENRDVLYSIAVLREYGPRCTAIAEGLHLTAYHAAEDNPKDKVVVAARFITGHTQVHGGTTNVARRLCDIAQRLYINPKANVPQAA